MLKIIYLCRAMQHLIKYIKIMYQCQQNQILQFLQQKNISMGCQSSNLQNAQNHQTDINNLKLRLNRTLSIQNYTCATNDDDDDNNITKKVYEKVVPSLFPKNIQLLKQTLKKHSFFDNFSDSQRDSIIDVMSSYKISKGQYVFREGDPATLFFIINKGKVQIQFSEVSSQRVCKKLSVGQCFGELALLYRAVRSASAKALQDCQFWCLSEQMFKLILKQIVKKIYKSSIQFIQSIFIFRYLPKRIKDIICYNMVPIKYPQNCQIFNRGDQATCFIIVVNGQIQIQYQNGDIKKLKKGQYIGQNCFKQNQVRFCSAKATVNTQCLTIASQTLKKCLGNLFDDFFYFYLMKWTLKKTQLFQSIPDPLLEEIVKLAEIKQFNNNQIILKANQPVKTFIICLEGTINGKEPGTLFNMQFLEYNNQVSTQTLKKQSDGCVGILSFIGIENLLNKNLKEMYYNHDWIDQNQKKIGGQQLHLTNKNHSFYKQTVNLSNLFMIKKLGEIQYGKAILVTTKQFPKQKYILKYISKNKIIKQDLYDFIRRQKEIGESLNFPFIGKTFCTFKDQCFIYFLNEHFEGEDLFDIMRDVGILKTNVAQFYLACLIISIQFLHHKNVVYRALKPENLILDSLGYLCLLDFGSAKILSEEGGSRTFTMIGTPHYMAPQFFKGKGYGLSCDYWSLGIIFYEMICGGLPYGYNCDDPFQIFKEIDQKDLQFPQSFNDEKAKILLRQLLSKNQFLRVAEDWQRIKKKQFFTNLDWNKLLEKKLKVPLKKKKKDTGKQNQRKQYLSKVKNYFEKQKNQYGQTLKSKLQNWDLIY